MPVLRLLSVLSACVVSIALAGCGGGGGSGGPITETPPPQERPADPEAPPDEDSSAEDIIRRADSLLVSTYYGDTSLPSVPTFVAPTSCSGASCSASVAGIGEVYTYTVEDLSGVPSVDAVPILTFQVDTMGEKTTLLTISSHSWTDDTGFAIHAWGAWLEHSGFGVETGSGSVDDDGTIVEASYRVGIAAGDLTGSVPGGTAMWEGGMVAAPVTGEHKDFVIVGGAELTFDLATTTIDALFIGRYHDIEASHLTVPPVQFDDVPVSSSGTFGAGSTGDRISGGFYGPDHAETAGVFEQSNLVGAFGAKAKARGEVGF